MAEKQTESASTPEDVKTAAETKDGDAGVSGEGDNPPPCPSRQVGCDFHYGVALTLPALSKHYEIKPTDPLYRPLWIYTMDPESAASDGGMEKVNVPYEPLMPGPSGVLIQVDDINENQERLRPVDLDTDYNLLNGGRHPSPTDPAFHQQMVYAVCSMVCASFRVALGRSISWGFAHEKDGSNTLVIRPHAFRQNNAYYERETGHLNFGYYTAPADVRGENMPEGLIFTALSHDIIAHETTHALLDGLRRCFFYPSNPQVPAFHEGFADIIAILQHFTHRGIVLAAIRRSRGNLQRTTLLLDLATQFGHTTGQNGPLRSAIDREATMQNYGGTSDPHKLGCVLVSALFDAFSHVFDKKVSRYVRLATGGSGILPPGDLPFGLDEVLADEAVKLASQFLHICIRAIDYCPPTDIQFGEYLRAMITADFELVRDDPWGYRESIIQAFRKRGIYPPDVWCLSPDALLWGAPEIPIPSLAGLCYEHLHFRGDPGQPASREELERQAREIGQCITDPRYMSQFGLVAAGDPRLEGDHVDPPVVESVRTARRVGPDGQIVFDLVVEVTQSRETRRQGITLEFYGGATILIDANGNVRYVIRKSVVKNERLEAQIAFALSSEGKPFWTQSGEKKIAPCTHIFKTIHNLNGVASQANPLRRILRKPKHR